MDLKSEDIILNENAYYYKIKSGKKISQTVLKALLVRIGSQRDGQKYALEQFRTVYKSPSGKELKYSIRVFKYKGYPTFIDKEIDDIFEIKYAYFILIEYKEFVIICKRNIANLAGFINKYLEQIDYTTISRLYLSERVSYEKLSMKNFDVSDNAVRSKVIEADNLQATVSGFGANRYILNGMRINDGSRSHHLAFNTSRINRLGGKSYLKSIFEWSIAVSDRIETFKLTNSYLDYFAKPIDIKQNITRSDPICILILWTDLYNDIERERINKIEVSKVDDQGEEKEVDINLSFFIQLVKRYNRSFELEKNVDDKGKIKYDIVNFLDPKARLRVNEKSFSILSPLLKRIKLVFENGLKVPLQTYLNQRNNFIVNYLEPQLVYFSKKLFEDNKLLGSIDFIENMFITCEELKNTTSEKGTLKQNSKQFTKRSIFGVVERELAKNSQYLICDDLGDEWADFIGIGEDTICFYHAKHNAGDSLSASKFQDVIGQAQKNLGNVYPSEDRWKTKKNKWKRTFNLEKKQTNIQRLRKGGSVDNAVDLYKKRTNSPNNRIQIQLVVDFISKKRFFESLEDLRAGKPVKQKAQVIQLLWFISSYISNCNEIGVEAYIVSLP